MAQPSGQEHRSGFCTSLKYNNNVITVYIIRSDIVRITSGFAICGPPKIHNMVEGHYKHQSLDENQTQFRLLSIRRASDGAPEYGLTVFKLAASPHYVALSYTWGPTLPVESISIEGRPFEIRTNLAKFLKSYQDWSCTYLWVDQICIDQRNIRERNHQVALMSKVYTTSEFVLVWLEDQVTANVSTSQAALEFCKSGRWAYDLDTIRKHFQATERPMEHALVIILRNSYFTRVWIVQEILMATKVRVLVEGAIWVSWNDLYWAVVLHYGSDFSRLSVPLANACWLIMEKVTRSNRSKAQWAGLSGSNFIIHTINMCHAQRCEDVRDKIYGFMSLVQEESRFVIDYNKSIMQVFLDALMALLKESERSVHGLIRVRHPWNLHDGRKASQFLALDMLTSYGVSSGVAYNDLMTFLDAVWKIEPPEKHTESCSIKIVGYGSTATLADEDEVMNNSEEQNVHSGWWYKEEVYTVPWYRRGTTRDTNSFSRIFSYPSECGGDCDAKARS